MKFRMSRFSPRTKGLNWPIVHVLTKDSLSQRSRLPALVASARSSFRRFLAAAAAAAFATTAIVFLLLMPWIAR